MKKHQLKISIFDEANAKVGAVYREELACSPFVNNFGMLPLIVHRAKHMLDCPERFDGLEFSGSYSLEISCDDHPVGIKIFGDESGDQPIRLVPYDETVASYAHAFVGRSIHEYMGSNPLAGFFPESVVIMTALTSAASFTNPKITCTTIVTSAIADEVTL